MATTDTWKKKICNLMKSKNLKPEDNAPLIETLSDILAQRDKVYKEYKDKGSEPVVEYTNKAGATNMSKSPYLLLWNDLNTIALAHWRELGLTPASYKKITGDKPKSEKKGGLVAALEAIQGQL